MARRNYYAFLRAAKHEHGITHRESQALYRHVKADLGRKPIGADVSRHPVVVNRNIQPARQEVVEKLAVRDDKDLSPYERLMVRDYYEDFGEFDYWEEWAVTFSYGDD